MVLAKIYDYADIAIVNEFPREQRFAFSYRLRRHFFQVTVDVTHGYAVERQSFCVARPFSESDKRILLGHFPVNEESVSISEIGLNTFYPRIWRPGFPMKCPEELLSGSSLIYWNSVNATRILVSRLISIFETIEPTENNRLVFGHRIRDVLLLACMESESAWAGVWRANEYSADRLTTNDYIKVAYPMQLEDYEVSFPAFPCIKPFSPFAGWNAGRPTKSLAWYHAYNASKHDRENSFSEATLEQTIHAVGAVVALQHAQFGPGAVANCELAVRLTRQRPKTFYLTSVQIAIPTNSDKVQDESWTPANYPFCR